MNKIKALTIKSSTTNDRIGIPAKEIYLWKSDSRWRRKIAQLGKWLLIKSKVELKRPYSLTTFQTVTLDTQRIVDAIEMSRNDMAMLMGFNPKRIMVGRDIMQKTFEELQPHMMHMPLRFNGEFHVREMISHTLNLEVIFNPWMDGWCFIPDQVQFA